MKTSIIIPNYNGANYIETCLDSLLAMDFQDYELIIIENASTDKSLELLKQRPEPMKLIVNERNLGFAPAINQGIKAASGDYVVLLNNDVEVTSTWLSELVASIEKDHKIFAVSSKMLRYDQRNIIDDAGDGYTILGWAYKHGDGMPSTTYMGEREVFSACGGAAIYRKSVFEEIGYFDEAFFAYMEDVDMSLRARLNGYKILYASDAAVYHIGSATSGGKYNGFKVKLAARNNLFVIWKNMPVIQILMNSPFLLIGEMIKLSFMLKAGHGDNYVKGKIEGFKELKHIKRQAGTRVAGVLNVERLMIADTFELLGDAVYLLAKRLGMSK